MQLTKTLKIKVKPESHNWLNKAATEINCVWNWANATSYKALTPYAGARKYLSGFDLINLASGATAGFDRIGSANINNTLKEYAQKRKQFKKVKLKWRASFGSRKALGWIPMKPEQMAKRKGNGFRFCGKTIRLFENIEGYKFKEGCFAQDSVGDWWFCAPYAVVSTDIPAEHYSVGIDLGLKDIATLSNGNKLENGKHFRKTEAKIAQAQRRGHKKQAKFLHRKVKRQRVHALHGFSSRVINDYQNIYIGDVSSSKLGKTKMAKSIYDAGWGMLKAQLLYKGQQANRCVQIVSEKNSTRVCSSCGCVSGPSGLGGLAVRNWTCGDCGDNHDRDVNAARNIVNFGMKHHPPLAGTSQDFHRAVEPSNLAFARHGPATVIIQV